MELFHFFMVMGIIGFIGVLAVLPISSRGLAETKLERFCVYVISSIMITMTVVGSVGMMGVANV